MAKMSSANLIILGLILDKPMSAYEIAQIIENQVIGILVKISSPTVYKNIKLLHKEGYLSMEIMQESEMPPKKVYTVTPEGREHFQALMEYYSQHFEPPVNEYNAFLINIDKVDKETGLRLLENLRQHLLYAQKGIAAHHRQFTESGEVFFAGWAIIKQYHMHLDTYVEWINDIIDAYRQEQDLGHYVTDGQHTHGHAHIEEILPDHKE